MKKTLTEYNRIVHYGCSFTFGQDSGGDGIHDDTLSYPSFLSKLLNNEYINKGRMGASNFEICSKFWMDIYNKNFDNDTAVIANLTSPFKSSYVKKDCNDFIDPRRDIVIHDKQVRFYLISPWSNHYTEYRDLHLQQSDLRFYLDTIQAINAMQNLSYQYKIPLLILDMHVGTQLQGWKDFFPQFDADKHIIRGDRPYFIEGGAESSTPSGHFYATGYENIANKIYKDIKNEKL